MFNPFIRSLESAEPHSIERSIVREVISHKHSFHKHKKNANLKSTKSFFTLSFDDIKNVLSVSTNKEKATVKFPPQKDGEIFMTIDDDCLIADYGDDPTHSFSLDLAQKGTVDFEKELKAIESDLNSLQIAFNSQKYKNWAFVDFSLDLSFMADEQDGELNFDLEEGLDEEEDEDEDDEDYSFDDFVMHFRIAITKKNIYYLITFTNKKVSTPHKQFINSLKFQ